MKGGFKVAAERCAECLFSPDRIVDGARMAEVLRDCRRTDGHFICHKFGVGDFDEGLDGEDVCCRGFYDTQPPTQLMRIAERVNMIEFVPLPTDSLKLVPERLRRKAAAR